MTASPELDGAFQEEFLYGVTKKGGSEVQFASVTEFDSLDPKEGDKDGESVVLGNGGRIWKRTPEGDFEFTHKIYPLSVDITDANDLAEYFMASTADTAAPILQVNTRNRDLFRVALLWQANGGTATTASGATTGNVTARRLTVKDCRLTAYKDSFDDGILSAEVTFKAPPFDLNGNGNISKESVTASDGVDAGLPALASY